MCGSIGWNIGYKRYTCHAFFPITQVTFCCPNPVNLQEHLFGCIDSGFRHWINPATVHNIFLNAIIFNQKISSRNSRTYTYTYSNKSRTFDVAENKIALINVSKRGAIRRNESKPLSIFPTTISAVFYCVAFAASTLDFYLKCIIPSSSKFLYL